MPGRPPGEVDAAIGEIEERFQSALASGSRGDGLRAVRALHAALRRERAPWALAAAQVWLTCLAGPRPGSGRALRRVRRAGRALERLGRLDWASRALAQEGRLAMLEEDWRRASTLLGVAVELGRRAERPVPAAAWAALFSRRGHAQWCLGEVEAARHSWQSALAIARTAGLKETEAACHASLSLCLWAGGQAAAGYVHASTALNWYRANGKRAAIAKTLYLAALMLEDFGHWRDATILLYEARDSALAGGDRDRVADTSVELVHAYVALGRLDEAQRELAEAWAASRSPEPPHRAHPLRHAELCVADAHIRLAQRRAEDAARLLRRARSLVGNANRPILTRRVAGHLNLAIQAGGGRLKAVEEMTAIIQAISARSAPAPASLPAADGAPSAVHS